MKNSVENLELISWKCHSDEKGTLIPIEDIADVGMSIRRTFFVYGATSGELRGQHAHKRTTQVLTCLQGQIRVVCSDGENEKTFTLKDPKQALKIPPGIWAEQWYEEEKSMLLVLCDTHYEADDYIWEKAELLEGS